MVRVIYADVISGTIMVSGIFLFNHMLVEKVINQKKIALFCFQNPR